MNWYATRSDDYVPPIARGMRRTDPKSRKRARILDDDELRVIWKVAENNGTFGAIVRLALLTAQRRGKLASIEWDHVTIDGVWNVATEVREKGNAGALVLPDAALQIIRSQNRVGANPYVFAMYSPAAPTVISGDGKRASADSTRRWPTPSTSRSLVG